MISKVVEKTITEALNEARLSIIRDYKNKGLRASGRFEEELEVEVTSGMDNVTGILWGANHTQYMQTGRRPNASQTAAAARSLGKILEQWVIDKGINVNPYAAAWKIVREGITVPNSYNPGGVISDTVNEDWLRKIQSKLGRQVKFFAMSQLKQFYINGNNSSNKGS